MTTDDEPRSGGKVAALIGTAMSTVDRMAGVGPATRPAHLAQLGQVLTAAAHEAAMAEENPGRVGRDADLWRLRRPGYLRAICEHPVGRVNGALVLLPVVLTWIVLGVAELMYVAHYTAIPADRRPPFFTDWLVQPWYRGPFALSAVIVLTVGCMMVNHHRATRQQHMADRLDALVHQLEVDLLPPLTILRGRLPQGSAPEVTRAAAADLSRAAGLFVAATERLADSMTVVDRLGAVVDRYTEVLPELRARTEHLAELDQRVGRSVGELSARLEPVTQVVATIQSAAETARSAVARSESVLREGEAKLDLAERVADHTEAHRAALEAARRPFVDAAVSIGATADKLDATVAAATGLAMQLGEVIKNVNWLALVADGLRDGDRPAGHQPDEAVAAP